MEEDSLTGFREQILLFKAILLVVLCYGGPRNLARPTANSRSSQTRSGKHPSERRVSTCTREARLPVSWELGPAVRSTRFLTECLGQVGLIGVKSPSMGGGGAPQSTCQS